MRWFKRLWFLWEYSDRMGGLVSECHVLFTKAMNEKNHEQFEALRRDHARKADEYHRLYEQWRNI